MLILDSCLPLLSALKKRSDVPLSVEIRRKSSAIRTRRFRDDALSTIKSLWLEALLPMITIESFSNTSSSKCFSTLPKYALQNKDDKMLPYGNKVDGENVRFY